jgi:hypothetical protein
MRNYQLPASRRARVAWILGMFVFSLIVVLLTVSFAQSPAVVTGAALLLLVLLGLVLRVVARPWG